MSHTPINSVKGFHSMLNAFDPGSPVDTSVSAEGDIIVSLRSQVFCNGARWRLSAALRDKGLQFTFEAFSPNKGDAVVHVSRLASWRTVATPPVLRISGEPLPEAEQALEESFLFRAQKVAISTDVPAYVAQALCYELRTLWETLRK